MSLNFLSCNVNPLPPPSKYFMEAWKGHYVLKSSLFKGHKLQRWDLAFSEKSTSLMTTKNIGCRTLTGGQRKASMISWGAGWGRLKSLMYGASNNQNKRGQRKNCYSLLDLLELGEKRAVELNLGAIMTVLKTEENRMKHQIGQRGQGPTWIDNPR